MDWLQSTFPWLFEKIPVGWAAKQVVDWLKANARPLFDGISDAFGWLIDGTLALIQWPEEAKQAFFGQLLPAHAECLKAAPAHELTQRMLEHRLLKVDRIAIASVLQSSIMP